jgi:hypothetical protein
LHLYYQMDILLNPYPTINSIEDRYFYMIKPLNIFTITRTALMGLAIFCIASSSHGQKGYELGGWIGLAQYYGDLNTTMAPKQPGPMVGLLGRYNFNTRVSLMTSFNYGRVGASDSQSNNVFQKNRNLDFKSTIWDWTPGIEFNFFNYEHGSQDYYYTPYVKLGFSVFRYNPKGSLQDTQGNVTWHALQPLGTEGQNIEEEYSKLSSAATLAVGLKWDINYLYSINMEVSARRLMTDYLDDVSTVFPNNQVIQRNRGDIAARLSDKSIDPDLGLPGRQRGNSKDNDTYMFFSIGVVKYFGRIDCPPISNVR